MKIKTLIAILILIILILIGWLSWTSTTKNALPTTSSEVSISANPYSSQTQLIGKIIKISQNPRGIEIATASGNDYLLSLTSSTQVIRDVGGAVNGTFNFDNLHVGDSVGAQVNFNSDGTITPVLIEQTNSRGIE